MHIHGTQRPFKASAERTQPEIMNQSLCYPRNIKGGEEEEERKKKHRLHIHITEAAAEILQSLPRLSHFPLYEKRRISLMSNDYCNNDISVDYANVIAGLSPSVP